MTTFALPSQINDNNKHIFAMFIEMAQHNFFVLMKHIYETALHEQLNTDADGNQIEDFGKPSLWKKVFTDLRDKITTNEQAVKLKSLLYKHFPYLSNAIYLNKGSKYVGDLRTQLDNEGNPLVDTISDKPSSSGIVSYCKDELVVLELISNYFRPLRNKFRHNITDKQNKILEILSNYFTEVITKLIVGAEKEVTKKEKDGTTSKQMQIIKDQKMYFLRGALEIISDRFPDFDQEHKEAMKKRCTNYFYFIMFIDLFLEKKYVKQFIDKCAIFNDIDKKYGFEMLGVYCTKLPAAKYDVSSNNVALALDILNELSKCPEELYKLLSPQDQKEFRFLDEIYDEVFMLRKSDRFANLVMEYIDKNNLFERIRFQVSLGKYRYKFYNKTCIDGSTQVRTLQKDLNGFGRIDKMNEIRKTKWNNLIRITDNEENFAPKDTADTTPYITDHNPRYITNGNRIALWWNNDEKDDDFYIPTINGDKAPCIPPKAWMSIYELPAMMFLIKLKGAKFVEDLIIKKCDQKLHLYNTIANDSWEEGNFEGIDPKDLPRCLSNGSASDTSSVMAAIKDNLREDIKKMEQYIEETDPLLLKTGRLGAWLSKDIVFWMKKGTAPTGKNFRSLQDTLSTFTFGNVEVLQKMFNQKYYLQNVEGLKNKQLEKISSFSIIQCHPFIKTIPYFQTYYRMGGTSTIANICKEYIAKEKEYLEKVADKNIPIYEKIVKRHDSVNKKDKASKLASNPIELPTQMFEAEIRNATGCFDTNKNVAYIINNYLQNTEQDSVQSFYEMKRSYKVFEDNKKPVFKSVKEIEEGIKAIRIQNQRANEDKKISLKFVKNTETTIKRFKLQDIIMFWMAKKTLLEDGMNIEDFKLKNVFDNDQHEHILSNTGSVAYTVRFDDGGTLTICQNGITLKNHSTLYRLIYDRRLKSLAKNLKDTTIDRNTLEYELSQYDRMALEITKMIMDFEDNYSVKYATEEATLSKNKKTNNFKDMIMDTNPPSPRISGISGTEKTLLVNIRNSFNHWSYPEGIADVENAGEGSGIDINGNFRKYNKAKKVRDVFDMSLNNISLV
ncbi:MAG: type VI-B CRISPR-associated RNA-guided ribonuclease Cas13b [Bacteroidales bacterium]|nr:type VI-B CRISPR-associated RNA-guided ribonuclease Cas13b [Bacteroidales bacterium]